MVLEKLREPLALRVGVVTPALARGQVLVALAYSGVCHSQLMEARGERGKDPYLPHLLGHEGSGVVREIGPGVSKVKVGDKVILTWIKGSGLEGGGAKYKCGDQTINSGAVTTFNEMAVVSENRLVAKPKELPMDLAVLFGCALLTGSGIVINTLKPTDGSTIVVFGLGGIGLSALMATRLFKCKKIIAIDVEKKKLELARDLGATHLIDASVENPLEAVLKITEGAGVDYAVESAGRIETIEQAFKSVRKGGGRCVFASHPPAGQKIGLDPHDLISGRQIEGSWGGASDPDRDIPLLSTLYAQGKLPLERLIEKRYRLDQINEALEDLENRLVLRPLVEIDPSLGRES